MLDVLRSRRRFVDFYTFVVTASKNRTPLVWRRKQGLPVVRVGRTRWNPSGLIVSKISRTPRFRFDYYLVFYLPGYGRDILVSKELAVLTPLSLRRQSDRKVAIFS